jgi:hypothetical protein
VNATLPQELIKMEKERLAAIIQKRLRLNDDEFKTIRGTLRLQRLFENALRATLYRLVAEVVESHGCHSGHIRGQQLIFDAAGDLLKGQTPSRVCPLLMPHWRHPINAFFDNLMNGRDHQ